MTKRKYSGDSSKAFWDRLNSIKGTRGAMLYTLGCILQDLECNFISAENRVLDELMLAEKPKSKRSKGGSE